MNERRESPDPVFHPGTGALCPEAQADGVPCMELGRECETCRRAVEEEEPHPKRD